MCCWVIYISKFIWVLEPFQTNSLYATSVTTEFVWLVGTISGKLIAVLIQVSYASSYLVIQYEHQ